MIKYYDNEAAYEADVKSDFESQISLIGQNNVVKYDGRNVIVGLESAKTGSIAVLDGNKAMHFVSVDTFSSASFMSNYEVIGVVWVGVDWPTFRGQVVILNKEWASYPMCTIYQWRLSGYILDGTDRTGTLSIRQASDSWATNHDYVVSYNATDEAGLVEQLNSYFRANEPFIAQEWKAVIADDGGIDLQLQKWTTWQSSSYNAGKDGFSLTANLLPEWLSSVAGLKINGNRYIEGCITNWLRALTYFRSDNSSTSYNPNKDVTSLKVTYPICLPGYLGTSKYQSDHCAFLRSVYGEGEEGWLKFMKSFFVVRPSVVGTMDETAYGDAKRNTHLLASVRYIDVNGTDKPVSPACDYIANIGYNNEVAAKGKWVMPTTDMLFDIVWGVDYPLNPDRDSDIRNKALNTIGAKAFGNNSYVRSCSRYSASYSFIAGGSSGFASGSYLCVSFVAAPLLLLPVAKHGLDV